MKKNILSFIVAVLVLSSCDKTPILQDVDIITNTSDIVNTALAITFVDGKDGHVLGSGGEIIKVTITGQDADDVYDVTGKEKETFSVSKGFLTLGVYSSKVPSEFDPLKFNLVVTTTGFVKTSIPVTIYGQGRINKEISLVRFDDPPAGVATFITNKALNSGALVNDLNIVTDEVGAAGTKASITASAGTVMKDADGNLLEGQVNIKVAYFSNQEENSLSSYPGGLVAEVNENGTEDIVEFYSAGFVAIEIRDNEGREAKTFENGTLDVEIEIPSDTYNPVTGTDVQSGDVIPVWSYDVNTGIWEKEIDLVISTNVVGVLVSTAQLNHLSYWNWDWKGDACGFGIKINICSDVDPIGTPVTFRLEVTRCSDGVLLNSKSFNTEIGDFIQFQNVPDDEPVMIRAYLCGDLLGEQKVDDMCDIANNFYINPVEAPTEISISVDGYCPNGDVIVRPTFAFWYKNLTDGECSHWYAGWFIDGEASIRVSLGKMYRFVIYYNGNWVEHDAVIQTNSNIGCENIPFSSDMCDFFQ